MNKITKLFTSSLFVLLMGSCHFIIDDSFSTDSFNKESETSTPDESITSQDSIIFSDSSSFIDSSSILESNKYEITFVSNGGKGIMENQIVDENSFSLKPCEFEMENCIFEGWALSANDEFAYYLDQETIDGVTSDLVLYAIYKIDPLKVGLEAKKYQDSLPLNVNKDEYAYYGGKDNHDILNYIPNFNRLFKDIIEYQFGKIVYVGSDKVSYDSLSKNFINCSQSYKNASDITLLDAYLELAYSYYYQYRQIQYDQGSSYQRKIRDMKPEDATELYNKYMDCSTFVSNAFYNAFNEVVIKDRSIHSITTKVLIDYAKNNQDNNDVILYQDNLLNLSDSQKQVAMKKFKETLQPGDLYVYRHGESIDSPAGHVMLYVGDGYFLHSTGSSYNYSSLVDKIESYPNGEGSVRKQTANSTVYSSNSTRYLFYIDSKNGNSNDRYAILRPLNRNGLKISNTTLARCMAKGLEIEKVSSHNTSVTLNDTITYTINITNNSNKEMENIAINDKIPEYTSFLSISDSYSSYYKDGNIIFNIDRIAANQTIQVSYSVIVTSDNSNIGKIISSTGTVNNIDLNTINLSISSLNNQNLNDIVSIALSYYFNPNVSFGSTNTDVSLDPTTNKVVFANGVSFIRSVYYRYYQTLGINFDLTSELSIITGTNFINQIIDVSGNKPVVKDDTILSKMLVNGGYGGTYFTTDYYMDRMRLVKYEYLLPGDIIAFHNSSATNAYLYLGSVIVDNVSYDHAFAIFTSKDTVKLVVNEDADSLIVKLNGYKRFAVLRPSLYI